MGAKRIDGTSLAASAREHLADRVKALRAASRPVGLDAILVDAGDTAARVYTDNQKRTCDELGIDYRLHGLPGTSGHDEIAGRVLLLNNDERSTAIMLCLPLPQGVEAYAVQRLIAPEKDVEGVNPANIGNVVYGRSSLAPCTALAAVAMVRSTGVDLKGRHAVVVGASNHVGKPIAILLMREGATVTSCNEWTPDLAELCLRADVLVAAAGVPGLITAAMVKPGAVVVDVGVNRIAGPDGKRMTVGDVAFDEVCEVAGWISPVPGGVGPMTVATLLGNVVDAAERHVCR